MPVQAFLRLNLNAASISSGVSLLHIAPKGLIKQYIYVIQINGLNKGGTACLKQGRKERKKVLREGGGAYIVTEENSKIEIENNGDEWRRSCCSIWSRLNFCVLWGD